MEMVAILVHSIHRPQFILASDCYAIAMLCMTSHATEPEVPVGMFHLNRKLGYLSFLFKANMVLSKEIGNA